MSRADRLHQILSDALIPQHIHIENESYQHRVPKDAETHFKVVIVSPQFEGLSRVARQRLVHSIIAAEFNTGLHAISLSLYTQDEWQRQGGQIIPSPPCHRKKRND